MSHQRKHCSFEFSLNNVLQINQIVKFPPFSTSFNIKWHLSFHPYDGEDKTKFILTLKSKPYGNIANESNVCYDVSSIIIFTKSLYSNEIIRRGVKNVKKTLTGLGKGYHLKSSRSSLLNNMIVGVNLCAFPFDETDSHEEKLINTSQISRSLISAWNNELNNPDQTDVKIKVQDKIIYARSSILAARSDYFKSIFNGNWKESSNTNGSRFKYVIEITDFDLKTVLSMLRFFYTDEISIDDIDNDGNFMWNLFSISDKYLLDDLRRIIKLHIFDKLDINNSAEILFKYAWKWPDLKDYIIKFIVENVKSVRNSKGYKDLLANHLEYSNFHELNTEIFLKLYPDDESNIVNIVDVD